MEIWRGYVHPHTHPHTQLKKSGIPPYPYPYPVYAGILRQNGDGFGQYLGGRVYLQSLVATIVYYGKL